ncbi:hypothetical protein GFL91_14285 [Rhizobium leguminosarum bv. viciae]|uniref:Uncharacterized protein n=1 Tax=Rhizobium leguminosarum bv. viciae TaxID=387 RepID=A0A8I2GTH0_RHILV|nr:hypothetical protein [Rhizobium leguminosarum]MBY5770380.1 hypothetical protein [Rhizobium leguminosarum]NKM46132.1 hypothetical protein [Rhizobium leguminosarum bv. viciae]TCA01736.1 hypothetical protein E0H57_23285 [Rhizobium leguminosarum bv. viciae]UFW82078.1 hypothetical protein RlegSU303_29685 [Rhizobium leguminosarum bv. viciae]
MPCDVTVLVEQAVTALTVGDGLNPYFDKNNLKLENLTAGPSTFETSVPLDSNNEAMVFVRATDVNSIQQIFKYNIPDELDGEGKIYVPKRVAASQSDLDKLAEEVESLKERMAGVPR